MRPYVRLELNVTSEDIVNVTVVPEDGDQQCVICLEDIEEDETELPCGHVFHTKCLFEWLMQQDTCPVCRATLPLIKPEGPEGPEGPEHPEGSRSPDGSAGIEPRSIDRATLLILKVMSAKTIALLLLLVNYFCTLGIMDQPKPFQRPGSYIALMTIFECDLVAGLALTKRQFFE